jgi:hypothetical protein
MIKTTDVRCGNYVQYNPDHVDEGTEIYPLQITRIDNEDGVIGLDDGFDNEYGEVELNPIPLTAEILEKAGFKLQPQKTSIFLKGRLKLWLGHNGAIAYLKNEDTEESYFIPHNPQSLHQLQNLYFALIGEELTINL